MTNEITSSLTDFMLEQRAANEHDLIKKAWADENILKELIANPKALLAKEMGLDALPENINIKVLEEDENTLYLVIPKNPGTIEEGDADDDGLDEELSQEALQSVAGGDNYVARGVSDVASVWKTGLPASFLHGINVIKTAATIKQIPGTIAKSVRPPGRR